jgi:hypothetical protein
MNESLIHIMEDTINIVDNLAPVIEAAPKVATAGRMASATNWSAREGLILFKEAALLNITENVGDNDKALLTLATNVGNECKTLPRKASAIKDHFVDMIKQSRTMCMNYSSVLCII